MDTRDSVAMVTGASSGIGRAVAEHLARAGAELIVHGRDADRTGEVARRVGGHAVLGDLATPAGVAEVMAQVQSRRGTVDILVANAGLGWSGPFPQMTPDEIGHLLAVDLVAPVLLVREILPDMVERGWGHIVLVGSVAGRTGVAGEAVYAAAKGGLDMFAESLRMELVGSGVVLSVITPAAVETPFFDSRGRAYDRRVPRPIPADTVARAVVSAIHRDRSEVWLPGWLRIASMVRSIAPGAYRRMSVRFGEPVRAARPRDRSG